MIDKLSASGFVTLTIALILFVAATVCMFVNISISTVLFVAFYVFAVIFVIISFTYAICSGIAAFKLKRGDKNSK